ncbi:inorganic triphosphatase [Halomonas litopenaei]|uniref:CYTH domain-containing protein n=1 Tax=Halomonas litopenaei TaxID=2109328 RepID=UPI001A8F7229|nr:CYTH domain-containing protein [Halomonas litopenaei]MBN8411740.1 CYTH domain-containing protein [Halomonas litopenaei]
MSHEIELKLALGQHGPDALRRHPRLAGADSQRKTLINTYFDTPEDDLKKARVALRLRKIGDQWLQTLKTSGQGSSGLSTRGEWEWQVDGDQLDLDGLRDLPPFQALADDVDIDVLLSRLRPRFTTNFQRQLWWVDSDGSQIEVALDEGSIEVGEACCVIRELELELKQGEASRLLELAEGFAESVPLRPSDSSKAARGTALTQGWQLPLGRGPQDRLHQVVVALDAYADTQQQRWREAACEALGHLAEDSDSADISHDAHSLRDALQQAPQEQDWLTSEMGALLLRLGRRLPQSVEME